MRILIGTSSLPPAAGVGTYVHNLAIWMSLSNHEVLVCRSSPVQKGNIISYPYKIIDIPVPEKMKDEHTALFRLYEVVNEFSPEAIINNDNIYLSNLLPYLSPEIVRISVVHGYRGMGLSWDEHLIIFNAALLNYQYVDHIIAISTPMKEAILKKLGCSTGQVKLVFNGSFGDNRENKKSQYPHKPIQIVFGGGNNWTKGADVVLCAARKMSHMKIGDYQINWIGHLAERGKYSKKHLDTVRNVRAFGYIPSDKLQVMLAEADILVMPSRAEGCPMLLLEAMSKGMVIIVSDCPSAMKEIVIAANAGFVISAGSSKELLDALIELIESNTKRKVMSENAVDFYNKNLTMDCSGAKIEELCRKRCASRNAKKEDFPPQCFIPYHRRPYAKGSLFKLTSVKQRIRITFGWLPPRRHINI